MALAQPQSTDDFECRKILNSEVLGEGKTVTEGLQDCGMGNGFGKKKTTVDGTTVGVEQRLEKKKNAAVLYSSEWNERRQDIEREDSG